MRAKTSVFIATSLDGFIARKNGTIDWLEQANVSAPDGEDYGYRAFMDTVDVLVMGRNSYDQVLTFDRWPYGDKRVIVLSRRTVEIPDHLLHSVSASMETPGELLARLSALGVAHVYVDGGVTIQRFLAADLIDEITITQIPVLLGEGLPLFGPLDRDVVLTHIATRTYDNGFVQSTYRISAQA